MRSLYLLVVILGLIWLRDGLSSEGQEAAVTGALGDPVPSLSPLELKRFELGRSAFVRRFKRYEGLGPHFNATSCASCHEDPTAGGSSQRYRDFFLAGRLEADGSLSKIYPNCTEENQASSTTTPCLPSIVVPHFGPKGSVDHPIAPGVEHPGIPVGTDVVARRNAPPLFGVGLFRLVPDHEILSRADPGDSDGDGVSGRVNIIRTEDDAIGRFGYKCQTASIEAFNRGALRNQMGITSDSTVLKFASSAHPPDVFMQGLFSAKTAHAQVAVGEPTDRIVDQDAAPDPEIQRESLLALIFFQENLAAPRRGPDSPAVQRGERTFSRIGCAACHAASLSTEIGVIHPYSDLLLHDMGPELADGVIMHEATGREFRTQPLWGLCHHAPFLHDGRADTIEQAILLHGGEADHARERYRRLSATEKRDLQRFLTSL